VKKKHVLFIVENNPVPRDTRVWNEARAVKELGHDVSIICPYEDQSKQGESVLEGIRIYRHPRAPEENGRLAMIKEYTNALVWEFLLSLRIFLTHPFKVIHSANPPDHVFLISLPFKLFGVKYIFDHHDLTPETYVAKFGKKGLLFRLLLLMERLTYKTADLVVATNESYKKVAIRRGGKKDQEVVVVRNGPTLTPMHDVAPDPRLREGFAYMVAYVGVIGQQDQVENIIELANYLVRERKREDIKFIVVGTGPYLKSVIKQCHDLGLEHYVRFTGYIPDKDLYEILATADVCINPEYGNAFTDKSTMMKIMEYMAVRRPIVQYYTLEGDFSAGEAAVSVRENKATKLGDALIDLLADPERRSRMGAFGRKRVEEKLEWPRQKERLKEAYRRLLST
jgi:glycosyltransferase involved in cell wall biosynthesis